MSDLNQNEIAAAKKRIEDMRNRAKSFVDNNAPDENHQKHFTSPPTPPGSNHKKSQTSTNQASDTSPISSLLSGFSSADSSTSLILALILILSREKADNMLILALLYILL